MEMNLGQWATSASVRAKIGTPDVVWRECEVMNGHMLLVGASGCGKTHTIRNIVKRMSQSAENDVRFHVFDVHDDIELPNSSEVFFSESSEYGLNPFVVDPDRHTGGVRKAIQNFISTINRTSRKIGDRQEAVLRALLEDLYAANGFFADRPQSWSLDGLFRGNPKKSPTINDLHRYTMYQYKRLFLGGDNRSASALNQVNRESSRIQKLNKEDRTQFDEKLAVMKDKAIQSYTDYVLSIESGNELEEMLRYDSKTTLKSVLDRVDNIRSTGVFRNVQPNFNPRAPVWRYRLKALGSDEKKMFILFKLKEIYDRVVSRGPQSYISEVIIIDEANNFMDADPDNIINIMANEIRKFGVALICASQSFTHFTEDFLASTATKIILGIDEMYWDRTAKKLQIDKKLIAWIQPRRSALINIKRTPMDSSDPTGKERWFTTALYS